MSLIGVIYRNMGKVLVIGAQTQDSCYHETPDQHEMQLTSPGHRGKLYGSRQKYKCKSILSSGLSLSNPLLSDMICLRFFIFVKYLVLH